MHESGDTPSSTPVGHAPSHYNPVKVTLSDSIGAVFLGLVSLVLLIALLRSQARNRALLARGQDGSNEHD